MPVYWKKKGWSRNALARFANLSPHTVAALENGGGTLRSLAAALAVLGCQLNPEPARLAQLRRERGVVLAATARRVRVSRQTLTMLERGGKGCVSTFVAFAKALGVKPSITPAKSAEPTWYTPPHLLRKLYSVFGIFDLDPASPDPPTVRCRRFYTEADDGLLQPWSGVVYCNPPYDRLPAWTSKIVAEFKAGRVGKVVALIPCRPETRSWQMTVTSGAAIFVLEHRLRFGGRTYAPRFASAIAVWGATPAELAQLANVLPANHRMHSVYSKLVNAA